MFFKQVNERKIEIHWGINCQYLVGYFHKYSTGWMLEITLTNYIFSVEETNSIFEHQRHLNSLES